MPQDERKNKVSVRLDDEEVALRKALARRYGIDGSGVLRQALRRWAREEGITVPEPPPHPKKSR